MIDIQSDFILTQCDLLLLTETQISYGSDTSNIMLNNFNIEFSNDNDKFKSLAACYRDGISFDVHLVLDGCMVFSVSKETISILGLLIYKKNNMSNSNFVSLLQRIFSGFNNIDIILGDLNLDGFAMPQVVSDVIDNYDLLVKEATQLSGRMLDQLYVNKDCPFPVSTLVKNIYFSDHDAIICQLTN